MSTPTFKSALDVRRERMQRAEAGVDIAPAGSQRRAAQAHLEEATAAYVGAWAAERDRLRESPSQVA